MTRQPLTYRQEAEEIWQLGQDIKARLKAFDLLFSRMSNGAQNDFNAIAHAGDLDTIAADIEALGDKLCRLCEAAEEAEDRRRDNPLEPGISQ